MKSESKYASAALPLFPISLIAASISMAVHAQESDNADPGIQAPATIEEVQVLGRLRDTAGNVILERMEQEVVTDIISSDFIGRIGDSTVAAALRRVPGVTLVDDKFVFVRGLGERYSSTLLNGATVPSPDLSRSVIPLDIFPTSIVQSLAVQKAYSSDMPAAFGGGNVDIRTNGIPDEFLFSVELGTGYNSESTGDFLSYSGGGDDNFGEDDGTRALSPTLNQALTTYRGKFGVQNILTTLRSTDQSATLDEAAAINRQLATELNRDIDVEEKSASPEFSGKLDIGNNFYFDNGMELGFLGGVSYENKWRNSNSTARAVSDEEEIELRDETTYNVALSGNLNVGFRLNSENLIQTTSLFLRNTDDDTSITNGFDNDSPPSAGVANRRTQLRYEERQFTVNQIHGKHEFGSETRDLLGLDRLEFLDGLTVDWYFSDSDSTTDIPNEVTVESTADLNAGTSVVIRNSSSADYRFTELRDDVESWGWEAKMPFTIGSFNIDVSGGNEYWKKSRTYRQTQFSLGTVDFQAIPFLSGPLDQVYSDENILNEDLGFQIGVSGSNSESYIAANKVYALFGKVDATWNDTIRLAIGVRWEDYQQVGLTWDPLDFTGSQILTRENEGQDAIVEELQDATFVNDDFYPSIAVTYMIQDFWAEDFQLRFGWGQTTVRPDLREISDSSYIDPITDAIVFGNPDVVPSDFDNFDIRAEWFFSNGDNFTVSAFYKEISNPIEQFQAAAGDTNTAVEIINADSAEIVGIEIEFLKSLVGVAEVLEPFFLQGNVTVLDTELIAGDNADAPTNPVRDLVGASDFAANLILGFDSLNGKHAATLSYNVFGERLYFAGRNGEPDAFEQPFHSLDATYSYYPTDSLIVKLKASNILDESLEIERGDVVSFEEDIGQTISVTLKYQY